MTRITTIVMNKNNNNSNNKNNNNSNGIRITAIVNDTRITTIVMT